MRKLIFILSFFALTNFVNGADYYFSNSGADENLGTQASPWASVAKMQTTITSAAAGDRFFLERGSVWYQTALTFTNKTGSPILFRPYGTGERPILSGSKVLTMTNLGSGLYRSTDSDLPTVINDLRILGAVTEDWDFKDISQYQDSAIYDLVDAGSTTTITDNSQTFTTNQFINSWVGLYEPGDYDYNYSFGKVSSNTSTQLTFSTLTYGRSAYSSEYSDDFYVIQNNTPDDDGEWSYTTDLLTYYSPDAIGTIRASVVDTIIRIDNSVVSFSNIEINSANFNCVAMSGSGNDVTFDSCYIWGAGKYLIHNWYGGELTVKRSELAYVLGGGIKLHHTGDGSAIDSTYFHDISIYPGVTNIRTTQAFEGGHCILFRGVTGVNYLRRCYFDRTRMVVQAHNSSTGGYVVEDLFVNNYGQVLGDMGAIYTVYDNANITKDFKNIFFLNGGAMVKDYLPGIKLTGWFHALYRDENSNNFDDDSITIQNANCGYKTNWGSYNTFRHSNLINATKDITSETWAGMIHHDSVVFTTPTGGSPLINNTISYNRFVLDGNGDHNAFTYHGWRNAPYPSGYTFNNNLYITPSPSSHQMFRLFGNYTANWNYDYTFAQWQSGSGYDAASTLSAGVNTASVKVFKNWSASSHVFDLGTASYTDEAGSAVTGTVTVRPFYSKILFYTSGDTTGVDPETYFNYSLIPMFNYVPPALVEDTCAYHITIYDTIAVADSSLFYFENNLTAEYGSMTLTNHSTSYTTSHECQGSYAVNTDLFNAYLTSSSVTLADSFNISINYKAWYTSGTIYSNYGTTGSGFKLTRSGSNMIFITSNGSTTASLNSNGVILNGTCYLVEVRGRRSTGEAFIYIDGTDQTYSGSILTDFSLEGSIGIGANNIGGSQSWSYLDQFKYSTFSTTVTETDSCVMVLGDTLQATDTLFSTLFDYFQGIQPWATGYGCTSNDTLVQLYEQEYYYYANVNFTSENYLEYVTSQNQTTNEIEVRIDSIDGQLLGYLNSTYTGGICYSGVRIVNAITGVHRLYVINNSPGQSLYNIGYLRFYTLVPKNWNICSPFRFGGNWRF